MPIMAPSDRRRRRLMGAGVVVAVATAGALGITYLFSSPEPTRRPVAICSAWFDFQDHRRSFFDPAETFAEYRRILDDLIRAAEESGRHDIVVAAEQLSAEPGFEAREKDLAAACAKQ